MCASGWVGGVCGWVGGVGGQADRGPGGWVGGLRRCPPPSQPHPPPPPPHTLAHPIRQIVYLIIIADLLVGVPPHYDGLWTNLIGVHDPAVFYVRRGAPACLLSSLVAGRVCVWGGGGQACTT